MTVNGIIPAVQRSEKPCDSKQQSNCRSSQTRVQTVPSISSRNQILAIAVKNTEKQISNLFGPFQFYWISFFCSKCFVWVCSLKSCYISLLKSIKSYLVSSIIFFFFFFEMNFWKYLNKCAHETDRKSSSSPAKSKSIDQSKIFSKFQRCIQNPVENFCFYILIAKNSPLQIFNWVVNTHTSEVDNKDKRVTSLMLLLCFYF